MISVYTGIIIVVALALIAGIAQLYFYLANLVTDKVVYGVEDETYDR